MNPNQPVSNDERGSKGFREAVSNSPKETVIFAVDVLSQPQYRNAFVSYDPLVYTKTSRALPCARQDDIVVLTGSLDRDYYRWLRALGLGPARVVAYDRKDASKTLSELILEDPSPVLKEIIDLKKLPVFLPFYCSEKEIKVAEAFSAQLFGCDETITLKYFNKESFKNECQSLGISILEGITHSLPKKSGRLAKDQLGRLTRTLLQSYPKLIVRGALGSAGSSVYKVEASNLDAVVKEIIGNEEDRILVEPYLEVIASPNDQWVVDREGQMHHLGISAQIFRGLKHRGNLRGQYFSSRISSYIEQTSKKVSESMREHGYRGVLGIDYIVAEEGIYPIENNARLNGSTFTLAIIDLIEQRTGSVPCWKFYKAETAACTFDQLSKKLSPILFRGDNINSIFPFDCDTLETNGRFTPVLMAEDMYHLEYLEQALEEMEITLV